MNGWHGAPLMASEKLFTLTENQESRIMNNVFDAIGKELEINNVVACVDRSEDQDGDDLVTTSFGKVIAINHNGTLDIQVSHLMARFVGQHTNPLKRQCKPHIITRPSETVLFTSYSSYAY